MLKRRPPLIAGIGAAAASIALTTLLVFALKDVAPVLSLGVVYLLVVLAVATVWGVWLALATALVSALVFNFFHIPPTGRFTIANGENWVALAVFFVAAAGASSLAQVARSRALEADERRREADLSAELARLLLRGGGRLQETLPSVGERLARALGLNSAAIELRAVEAGERSVVFPLREGSRQIGTLVLPAGAPEASSSSARAVVAAPSASTRPRCRATARAPSASVRQRASSPRQAATPGSSASICTRRFSWPASRASRAASSASASACASRPPHRCACARNVSANGSTPASDVLRASATARSCSAVARGSSPAKNAAAPAQRTRWGSSADAPSFANPRAL